MREDQLLRLRETQEKAVEHAIEAIDMADIEDINTKDGRGNRAWLSKASNESLKTVCTIERLFQMRNGGKPIANAEGEVQAVEGAVDRATKKYEEFTQRKQ